MFCIDYTNTIEFSNNGVPSIYSISRNIETIFYKAAKNEYGLVTITEDSITPTDPSISMRKI